MDIQTDRGPLTIADGSAAIFVDAGGKVIGVWRVESNVFKDLMNEQPASHDPMTEDHSEIGLRVANVQASGGALKMQGVDTVRLCRNKFGNLVPCPPR